MKLNILFVLLLFPMIVFSQEITPIDLTPPSDTPREAFQKINTNEANIKERLDSVVAAAFNPHAPVFSENVYSYQVPEGGLTWNEITATDPEGGILTFSLETDLRNVWLEHIENGRANLALGFDWGMVGTYQFLMHCDDEDGNRSSVSVIVGVFPKSLEIGYNNGGIRRWIEQLPLEGYSLYDATGDRLVFINDGGTIFNIGSDSPGDMFFRGSNDRLTRLPIGAEGQILKIVNGMPAWVTADVIESITIASVTESTPLTVPYLTPWPPSSLPTVVTVVLSNELEAQVAVTWAQGDYDHATPGEYTLVGTLGSLPENVTNPSNYTGEIDVTVLPPLDIVSVASLTGISVNFGTAFAELNLPASVEVTLDEGSRFLPIVWSEGDYDGGTADTYNLTGELTLDADITNSEELEAEIAVTVNAAATNITSIAVSFSEVQRTNANISINATADASVSSWKWEILDAKTKEVVATSTDEDPVFDPITTPYKLFDLRLEATNATDGYSDYWHNAFYVHKPKPTEGECDIVVDFSSSATYSYFQAFSGADNAGLVIGIKGTHVDGNSSSGGYFYPDNLRSSDPDNPVLIVKLGTEVSVIQNRSGSGSPHVWRMDNNAENVVIDGYLPNGEQGIKVQAINVGSQNFLVRGRYTGIHVTGMVFNQDVNNEIAGSNLTLSPSTSSTTNASTYIARNCIIFDNVFERSNQEAIYAGWNNQGPVNGYTPFGFDDFVIARNVIENSGRDGIQVGSASNIVINDNIITDWGWQHHSSHENAISWNAGNSGRLFNNYAVGGEMFFNSQTGPYPFNVFDEETEPRDTYVYNNVFAHGTYNPGSQSEPYANFLQTHQNSGAGDINYYFWNNTFIEDKPHFQFYSHSNSWALDVYSWNNIIISPTATISTAGPGTPVTVEQSDLTRTPANISQLMFTSVGTHDYTIAAYESPVYSGSPVDLVDKLNTVPDSIFQKTFFDYSGSPLLATGRNFTFGAYSGAAGRINDPDTYGALTFSTAFGTASIGISEITLEAQPDQNGWLYVMILPDGSTVPTNQEILEGPTTVMTNGGDGVMSNAVISGLVAETTYDIYAVFINTYGYVHSVTPILNVETDADEDPFEISDFWISSLNRNRVYFTTSSELGSGTVFTGFSFSSGKTISSVTVVNETKAYFTMNSAYTTGNSENITYSGGSNIVNVNGTPLETFTITAVDNHITSAAAQSITIAASQNGTFGSDDWVSSGSQPSGLRAVQGIPAGSVGYIQFKIAATHSNGISGGFTSNTSFSYAMSQMNIRIHFESNNSNTSVYTGNTFENYVSGQQTTGHLYRIRLTGTSAVGEYSTNGGSSWNTIHTESGIGAAQILYGAVNTTNTGTRQLLDIQIQCNDGLIVDTE